MNEVPKLLIFRQKTTKKGRMDNGISCRFENYNFKKNLELVRNHLTIIFQ